MYSINRLIIRCHCPQNVGLRWPARVLRDAPVLPLQAVPVPRSLEDYGRGEGHRPDTAVAREHTGRITIRGS